LYLIVPEVFTKNHLTIQITIRDPVVLTGNRW
jgi:hypothetical protein